MEQEPLDDLVRRLTALVVKIDERDTHMVERLEQHEAHMARLDTAIDELRAFNREQREFNKQQLAINADLKTLMTRVFQERENGHEA